MAAASISQFHNATSRSRLVRNFNCGLYLRQDHTAGADWRQALLEGEPRDFSSSAAIVKARCKNISSFSAACWKRGDQGEGTVAVTSVVAGLSNFFPSTAVT